MLDMDFALAHRPLLQVVAKVSLFDTPRGAHNARVNQPKFVANSLSAATSGRRLDNHEAFGFESLASLYSSVAFGVSLRAIGASQRGHC